MNRAELFYTDEETGIHPISIELAIQLLNGHHTRYAATYPARVISASPIIILYVQHLISLITCPSNHSTASLLLCASKYYIENFKNRSCETLLWTQS